MWKFLGGLVNSFLLLRDIFGYAGPGAIFLGLALFHFRTLWYQQYLTDHEQLAPFWFFALALFLVSYVAGNGLAAVGYMLLGFMNSFGTKQGAKKEDEGAGASAAAGQSIDDEERKVLSQIYPDESVAGLYEPVFLEPIIRDGGKEQKASGQGQAQAQTTPSQPAQLQQAQLVQRELKQKKLRILQAAAVLYYRHLYPQLFIDADRRGVINILRIALGVALIADGVLFLVPVPGVEYEFSAALVIAELLKLLLLGCGIFMLWNGHTGQKHVGEYYSATLKAALRAQQNGIPIFRWDECCDKKSAKEDSDDGKSGNKK